MKNTPEIRTISTIRTAGLDERSRSKIVRLCIAAHEEQDFENLFSYLPPDGLHVVAFEDERLVGHAVVTTRWLQPGVLRLLRTAYVDAVAVSPEHQGRGIGSAVMQHLATVIDDYEIACLETDLNSDAAHVRQLSPVQRPGGHPVRAPVVSCARRIRSAH